MRIPNLTVPKPLTTTKGNPAQRTQKAFDAAFDVASKLKDAFEKDKIETDEDIKKIVAPSMNGVDFSIADIKNDPGNAGFFMPLGNPSEHIYFVIGGPFSKDKSTKEKVTDWTHEIFHSLNNLLFPKMLARPRVVEDIRYRHRESEWAMTNIRNFTLYRRHYNQGYQGVTAADKRDLCKTIKKQMKRLLSCSKMSSAEKIDTLQNWRYKLLDERGAYTAETVITKTLFARANTDPKELKASIRAEVKEVLAPFLFDQKIKIIEDVLKGAIKKHRIAHAKKLRAQKSS